METEHILTVNCAESPGIVHAITGYLLDHDCDIIDSKHFGDRQAQQFFMRVHFAAGTKAFSTEELRRDFSPLAQTWSMNWQLEPQGRKRRVLVMVSKFEHCLNDLLYRRAAESLRIDVPLVVGNHPDLAPLAAAHGVPFEHVPAGGDPLARQRSEGRLLDLVGELGIDFVVLARYMQVLSDELSAKLTGKTINIHHSFLPSFKGAKPYHQAYERGVKTVGATAHYVNAELDEGPIISQQVIEVDHTYTADDLVQVGRDAECAALRNAVRWHCEGRIQVQGNRTVILR
jgi:formyltetrahydrofolate deformylase